MDTPPPQGRRRNLPRSHPEPRGQRSVAPCVTSPETRRTGFDESGVEIVGPERRRQRTNNDAAHFLLSQRRPRTFSHLKRSRLTVASARSVPKTPALCVPATLKPEPLSPHRVVISSFSPQESWERASAGFITNSSQTRQPATTNPAKPTLPTVKAVSNQASRVCLVVFLRGQGKTMSLFPTKTNLNELQKKVTK